MEGKYVVATAGVVGAAVLGVADLYFKGPDTTVITAIIGAITFIAGLCFGRGTSPGA